MKRIRKDYNDPVLGILGALIVLIPMICLTLAVLGWLRLHS